jgi:diguanylate cyclase (GGDEF)-like protein
VRLLGAAVVGASLTISALTTAWMALSPAARGGPTLSDGFFVELALFLVIALGMQLMTFEDMTEELKSANAQLKAAQIELRHMVVTDSLTGLHNRRFFEEIIAHELNLHRRYGTPLSLVFLDIDRFKSINDTLGHAAGDATLCEVAAFLTRHVRNADYVFRWGGDEFLVLLTHSDEATAAQKAEELGRHLPHIPGAEQLQPTLSVGWATHRAKAEFPKTLAEADARMYEMKLSRKREREARERDLGRL